MLIWLLHHISPLLEQVELHTSGDSRVFLTARVALATMTSFLAAIIMGPAAIRWLKSRFRERIGSDSARLNELHAAKNATPTMGGIFIVASIVISGLLWGDLSSAYVPIGIVTAVAFGTLGGVDDWIKLSTSHNGLTIRQKLICQIAIAAVTAVWCYFLQHDRPGGLSLIWPFGNVSWQMGLLFIPWGVLVLVSSSNSVNLTDGLDGLASGCAIFAGAAFAALAYVTGHAEFSHYFGIPHLAEAGELAVILGSMVGAMLGFLWFNCYPAQVFMGDTGSLPIGGLLGLAALVTRQEVLLIVIGGIFVIETISVILQVVWFRSTGRRLLACSPLHNHFLFRGDHEIKIVVRFWIGSALLALIGVASLKIS
ncbi:MAG: phospho-N-acetylmuramoyl-pentapeptide-transferase [Planctomycetaceae bacterium]